MLGPRTADITGQRFGRWTVVESAGYRGHSPLWLCRCQCGTERVKRGSALRSGHSRSCGCWSGALKAAHAKHGESGTRLYRIWREMRRRCQHPDGQKYRNYAGRGITVCDEWESWPAFRDWALANGYAPDLTIERIDNDAGYRPSNCTWIPRAAQVRNRRCTPRAPDGRPWRDIAAANGVLWETFRSRLWRGWSPQLAARAPPNTCRYGRPITMRSAA